MTTNEQVIRQLVEAANRHDVDAQAGLYSEQLLNHGRLISRGQLEGVLSALYAVFPDWRYEILHLISDDTSVMAQMLMTGTHLGTATLPVLGGLLSNIPPTGKSVSVHHFHLFFFEGDHIREHRAVRDDLGMMQQLGLIAETSHELGDISRPS